MDQDVKQAPPGWEKALTIGAAELARGEVVPASVVHDMLRTAFEELEQEMVGLRKTPTT